MRIRIAEQLGDKIVAFDLRGQRIPGQAEPLDEVLRVRDPVDLGMREVMRVEVADRAVELAEKFLMPKLRELARETRREYRHLLADRRRRRFLAVRPRHHRMRFVAMRQLDDRRIRRLEPRRQIVRDELLQDERVGEVVDVLGGAREMHHLDRQRRIDRGDSLFDEILDRLDVVIGGRLELLHAARIVEREVLVNGAELFRGRRWESVSAR